MNIVQSLGEYVNKVLDTNGDGRITFGDFVGLFPNYAVAIAIIFIDVVVLAAEYRVWDVGYQMTSDPFKAVGFVLVPVFFRCLCACFRGVYRELWGCDPFLRARADELIKELNEIIEQVNK